MKFTNEALQFLEATRLGDAAFVVLNGIVTSNDPNNLLLHPNEKYQREGLLNKKIKIVAAYEIKKKIAQPLVRKSLFPSTFDDKEVNSSSNSEPAYESEEDNKLSSSVTSSLPSNSEHMKVSDSDEEESTSFSLTDSMLKVNDSDGEGIASGSLPLSTGIAMDKNSPSSSLHAKPKATKNSDIEVITLSSAESDVIDLTTDSKEEHEDDDVKVITLSPAKSDVIDLTTDSEEEHEDDDVIFLCTHSAEYAKELEMKSAALKQNVGNTNSVQDPQQVQPYEDLVLPDCQGCETQERTDHQVPQDVQGSVFENIDSRNVYQEWTDDQIPQESDETLALSPTDVAFESAVSTQIPQESDETLALSPTDVAYESAVSTHDVENTDFADEPHDSIAETDTTDRTDAYVRDLLLDDRLDINSQEDSQLLKSFDAMDQGKICQCVDGNCLGNQCVLYSIGRECPDDCMNQNCKNYRVRNGQFPSHTLSVSQDRESLILLADERIPCGTPVAPCFGIAIPSKDAMNMKLKYPSTMYVQLNGKYALECTDMGSGGGFVRHVCSNSNAELKNTYLPNGDCIPVIVAKRDIEAGEEITRDYSHNFPPKLFQPNFSYQGKKVKLTKCNCGSAECRGHTNTKVTYDLKSILGNELLGCLPSISVCQEKLVKSFHYYPLREDTELHPAAIAIGKKCQYCGPKKSRTGVFRCTRCNVHLCHSCFFKDWHLNLNDIHVTTEHPLSGTTLNMKSRCDRTILLSLDAPKTVDDAIRGCSRRLDEETHAKIFTAQRVVRSDGFNKLTCLLCGSNSNVGRCVQCIVDVCEDCWYYWHPNMNPFCTIESMI